ncbi:TadE/TadG family type IV pilus assembly protein [Vibrio breoganii]
MSIKRNIKGIAIVEFSIVVVFMLVLMFTIAEMAKFMFSMQLLNEVTRRSARLATVCFIPSNSQQMVDASIINSVKPASFEDGNLVVEYLDINGVPVSISDFSLGRDISNTNQDATFRSIKYVKASISNYRYDFIFLPDIFGQDVNTQSYSTILPAESLGLYRPFNDGSVQESSCY